jgi:hypothetical protein
MIGKISKGAGFGGVLGYLLDPDKQPRVISNCMESNNARDLAREFRLVSNLNRRVSRPVRHFSIAFAPEDGEVEDVVKEAIALRVLDGLGYQNCQYIAVDHHRDDPGHDEAHNHDHLHLLTNAVDVFGNHVRDNWDMYKIQNILRSAETEFGLRQVESSWDVKRARYQQQTKIAKLDSDVVELVANSLQPRINLERWLDRLSNQNIHVRFNLSSKDVVKGITFLHEGRAYKGSDIGASWQKLAKLLDRDETDIAQMKAANLHVRELPIELNLTERVMFDRVIELAQMKLGDRPKFKNGRIEIESNKNTLNIYRVRPSKLMVAAMRIGNDWQPTGFPNIDLRDVRLLERLNNIRESSLSNLNIKESSKSRFDNLNGVDDRAIINPEETSEIDCEVELFN